MVKGEEGRRGIPKSRGGKVVQNKSSQEKNQVNEPFFFLSTTPAERKEYIKRESETVREWGDVPMAQESIWPVINLERKVG